MRIKGMGVVGLRWRIVRVDHERGEMELEGPGGRRLMRRPDEVVTAPLGLDDPHWVEEMGVPPRKWGR